MFQRHSAALLVIDLQEKLLGHVFAAESVAVKAAALVRAAGLLNIPVLATEQYPQGLGPTAPRLRRALGGAPVIAKRTFSCCRDAGFMAALEALGRRQVLVCGIETHVCVFQTVADLVARGYAVQVAADAVSSRSESDRTVGLERIRTAGGVVSSVESALFELLETSACPEFKAVSRLIK